MALALTGKNILLGISGGIAAYKAPQLVRDLRAQGAEVQVVLTASAARFVTATSLQAVSGRPVRSDLWDANAEAAMGHIELARWADALLIAPATANCIGVLAAGMAGDLLSTLYLATEAPVVVAPAMNQAMWRHPATQRNVAVLAADGVAIVGPDRGEQACGDDGPGRMLQPVELAAAVGDILENPSKGRLHREMDDRTVDLGQQGLPDLNGMRMLVTAGPTQEALDPVRYLSNHSSGKQGYALAAVAAQCGAQVTLISGPVTLPTPHGVERVDVQSATDMHAAVMARAATQDVVIGVAAVADYRPAAAATQKIKKTDRSVGDGASANTDLTLKLVQNPDIIASVANLKPRPLVVGFAAETHETLKHAREKRLRKGLDLIVVNDVSRQDIGFGSDHNAATLISADNEVALARQPKLALAMAIMSAIAELHRAREQHLAS
ncbi:MAG: bifunctional phosphopantothenoylcysteine decarboxylase/phosphopantothenate--cysteine ligase CoaBC [Pseudomonadales bacterium]